MLAGAVEQLDYQNADFKFIQSVIHQHAGINLHDGKKELVYSRLSKRVRGLGLGSFGDYCSVLAGDQRELLQCINYMTTNVTSFFRENHHFEFLSKEVLGKDSGKIRIWSAGCSSGEEPYSIAFTCDGHPGSQSEIVATDLDSEIIGKARHGVYTMRDVTGLTDSQLKRWFLRGKGDRRGQVKVADEFKKMVSFSQLNLKHEWQHAELFDVIFCRNVMIYFDNDFRQQLLAKFYDHLKPGGYLVLGHSESLFGLSDKFHIVGKTIHQKKGCE